MFRRLSSTLLGSRRRAWMTIGAWILLVGLLASAAPALDDVQSNGGDGPPETATSVQAEERLRAAFPSQEDVAPAVIAVRTDSAEATTQAATAVVEAFRARAGQETLAPISSLCADREGSLRPGEDCRPGPEDGSLSEDGLTRTVVVPVAGDPASADFRAAVDDLRAEADEAAGDGATTHVTGPAGIVTDTVAVFASGDRVLLLGTIGLVLVILLLVYRSPVLALLPLLAVGVAMRVAETVGALLAEAGVIEVSSQTASIMTVLLFGVGTDYALIITARYREELGVTSTREERHAAMLRAMGRTVEALASSAGTIVLAMMALLLTASPALRGFGPYLSIGVASMVLVAATFFPALLLVVGRAAFWPGGQQRAVSRVDSRLWHRVARLVDARPVLTLLTSLALLLALSAGTLGYKESFNPLTGFRVNTDSATGQQLIADELGPGETAPTVVLLEGGGLTPQALAEVADDVERQEPDVAHARAGAHDVSDDGRTARMTVVLEHEPYGPAAMEALPQLEETTRGAAAEAGLADVTATTTGETAETADIRSTLDADLRLIGPVMLLLVAGVLALLLRSLLAPVYLMASMLLSFLATIGLTVLVVLTAQGDDGIGNRVTVYVLVFLIALGVDYTIFLVSRLRQELDVGAPMRSALTTSLVRTGGVVSSAGVILAATFSVLMTQPVRELYQFGLAMALGLLLDTFVIRPLLVPAVIRLLGDRALWPYRPRSTGSPSGTQSSRSEDEQEINV